MSRITQRIATEAGLLELPHFRDLDPEQQERVVIATRQACADERRLGRRPRLRVVKAMVREELHGSIAAMLLSAVLMWVVPKLLEWLVSDGKALSDE